MNPSKTCQILGTAIILPALCASVLTACATRSPEQRSYEIADHKVKWLDRYQADRRACEFRGGYIVVERRTPCRRIRAGKGCQPDIGAHYYCRR